MKKALKNWQKEKRPKKLTKDLSRFDSYSKDKDSRARCSGVQVGWLLRPERLLLPTYEKSHGEKVGLMLRPPCILLPTYGKHHGEYSGFLLRPEWLLFPTYGKNRGDQVEFLCPQPWTSVEVGRTMCESGFCKYV
jgi:hypothetical protein